jgi:HEAT repeat protein
MLGRVATKALVGLLDDDNMCVPALQILATIADPAAITPVEHLLQRTSDDATRLEAAICLSQLGSSLGPAALAETAVGGSDYAWEAAVSLANAPGATLEQLTLSLQVAPWSMSGTMDAPSVAATRILAMGTRGRDSLSKRVRDRDSAAASAMSALSQAPPPDFIKLISESASRAASSDQFFDMAIRVLAEIGTSDAVEALMNLSRHDESSDARVTFALLHEALTGRLRRVDNRIIEWLTTRLDKFPDSLVALAALRKDDPQMVTLVE